MSLSEELARLDGWLERLPSVGMRTLGGSGSSMYVFDFIAIGAVKRSLSLASGLSSMIRAKNMICARALLRMHLDTVTRFLAYTYVKDPEAMARAVTRGQKLNKFKCSNGKPLTDAYLVDRLSHEHPWVRRVYDFTSGYVHFSERQFFDSIHTLGSDQERTMQLEISHIDSKFPEFSWAEVTACFNQLTEILVSALVSYEAQKAGNPSFKRTSEGAA